MMKMSLRLIVSILGTYACSLLFTLRSGFSVAIVSMVKSPNVSDHSNEDGQCISENSTYSDSDSSNSGEFEWSESLQGVVLGGAFYAYLITPTIAGRVTERFGAKYLTAFTVMVPAILTSLTPIAAEYDVGIVIAIRVIIGACNGCVYASLYSLYSNWFPKQERASAVAALGFGGSMGSVFMFPLAGYLCEYGFTAKRWPSVFYVTSLLHVPWIIAWLIFVDDSPSKSRRISQTELNYIRDNLGTGIGTPKKSVSAPWISILTSRVVWAAIIARTSGEFGYFLFINKMPSYLDSVHGFSLSANGLFNSLINLSTAVGMMMGGPLSDYINSKKLISLTRLRKNFEIFALLVPSLCLVLVPSFGCNSTAVITLFVIAMFAYGFITGGEWPMIPEFAPDFSGTIFGISNTFALSMGFVTPLMVGALTDDHPGDYRKWSIVFYITSAIYIIGIIVFELFSSTETQSWGVASNHMNEDTMNNTDKNKKVIQ